MSAILDIHARQIFDSRGNPAVEVDVITETETLGRFAVPSEHRQANMKLWSFVIMIKLTWVNLF